ncbi:mandelate racemase/muconate lactonizing enzyme family protein [uncultured Roseibium sp.]|uniref:mandelate racemase/muconate lactonizing enzyme family protein n=1 Tax=uncultured Roseibium sp. TaxID=1936171 RepID=UPI002606D428|nr:mandelate racemase/muconate lactonizing enzyme family protein [uncultured Roseibium sp.]
MKIVAVETLRLLEHPNLLWVRIHTSEGITGLGETYFGAGPSEADIHDRIAPILLGQDARRVEWLNMKMQPYVGFTGTGAEVRALAAVDVALWELAAKSADIPLCDLLGGRTRNAIQVYNTCAGPNYVSKTSAVRPDNFGTDGSERAVDRYDDLNAFLNHPEDLASSLMEMGIFSMKIWPLDLASGAADGVDISPADLKKGLEPFERIRKAHGDKMRLKAELHGLWSLNAAKKIASALEPLEMDWIEDPVWMDRTHEIAELARSTSAPLAGGETLASLGQFKALIDEGNISTPIVDVTWAGGVTAARKIAALAEASARPIAFHDCSGPVTLAASTHLALSLRNVREQEIARGFYYNWYQDFVDQLPPIENGMISVPDRAGLGMDLLPDLFKRGDAIHKVSKLT